MSDPTTRKQFLFVGNQLCLDFVNTQMIVRGKETDLITEASDLVTWLVQARVLSTHDAKQVIEGWGERKLGLLLSEAREFRGILRRMAERLAAGKRVLPETIQAINRQLSLRPGYPQILLVNGRFEARFHSKAGESTSLLTPLAEAASALLCSGDPSLVKKCRNAACILYFYDNTKNHARQWCSMGLCGNRIKVAAHYKRSRHKS